MRKYRFKPRASREEGIIDAACDAFLNKESPAACVMHPDDVEVLRLELSMRRHGPPLSVYVPHGVMRIEACNGVRLGEFVLK